MRKAHLAILPTPDGRRAERRIVNLAASLREPGASMAEVEVLNLSVTGFAVESDMPIETGAHLWLKLPGLEALNSKVVWVEGRQAGFEFVTPLHPATLDAVTAASRPTTVKRHFGVNAVRPAGGIKAR